MVVKRFIVALALLASMMATVSANAPGGAYIQCDPHNPSSPVRCKPDGKVLGLWRPRSSMDRPGSQACRQLYYFQFLSRFGLAA
jgi:hypothetical protein